MKRKTAAIILCIALSTGMLLTGCSSKDNTKESSSSASESVSRFFTEDGNSNSGSDNKGGSSEGNGFGNFQFQNGMTMGTVESVDEGAGEITISVVNMGAFGGFNGGSFDSSQIPFGGDSEVPSMPNGEDFSNFKGGDGSNFQNPFGGDGTMPSMPNGGDFSDIQPGAGSERPSDIPSGESTTYKVTKDTVITDESGNAISLSDISAGAYVSFTADGDTISSLSIMNLSRGQNGGQNNNVGSQNMENSGKHKSDLPENQA